MGDEQLMTRGEVVVKNQRPELNTDSGGVGGSDSDVGQLIDGHLVLKYFELAPP